jgi:hypothetical protein
MSHETGHSLGYPDLYIMAEYRRDLLYLNDWSVMSNHGPMPHHCGAIKVHSGWIGGDKGADGKLTRVVYVDTPTPTGPTATEALLEPNEYWDDGMEAAVQAAFPGVTAKVAQLVHIDLGGDGNQFDLIEARQKGVSFSQSLPTSPALLVLNVLDFEDDTRYAVDGKYRRKVQRLNTGFDLVKKGDNFDLASALALQAAGVSVTIRGASLATAGLGLIRRNTLLIIRSRFRTFIKPKGPGQPFYPSGSKRDQHALRFRLTGVALQEDQVAVQLRNDNLICIKYEKSHRSRKPLDEDPPFAGNEIDADDSTASGNPSGRLVIGAMFENQHVALEVEGDIDRRVEVGGFDPC